ncbi:MULTISPECIES: hypothetical protein [unclassified Empedobacter]|uniref:hypothetical protein n=1 Tax=unclassified Empedobacter TaxID=2643773 RepID=UPI0025C07EF3|nr:MULTISPECIES: hypothetical protein [unclassified Empedobacter]
MCLKDEIDGDFIANSIRMVKTEGYYILLEGENDELLFSKFFKDEYSSFEICHGKENLLSTIKILNQSNSTQNYIGILDKDLDFLNSEYSLERNVLYTDYHDLEIMCFASQAFNSVALEYFSKTKIKRFNNLESLKTHIIDLALQISKLRVLNFHNDYNIKLKPNQKNKETKELDYSKFICKKEFKYLGHKILLETISKYYNQGLPKKEETIINEINKLDISEMEILNLIHGHDLTTIIALGLKNSIGKSSLKASKREDIERALRLAYNYENFKNTLLYQKIISIDSRLLN